MQIISSTFVGYSVDPSSDLVIIAVLYTADSGQTFNSQLNGSNIDLTANAIASGNTTWSENDIVTLYGVTLSQSAIDYQQTAVAQIQQTVSLKSQGVQG